ncbi:MAG: hypothetical protein ACOVO1_09170, partial [Chitinophagaceae bacterium]
NTVNITINPLTPITKNTSASGCGSVVYKTITYTASTVLRDTVKSFQGCDSIYNVATITVHPTIATPTANVTSQPTCTSSTGSILVTAPTGNNLVYSVNGTNYQAVTSFTGLNPNTYSVTAKDNITGCISNAISLIINPVASAPAIPTASVTQQPNCNDPSGIIVVTNPIGINYFYSIDGVNYQSNPAFNNLLPSTYSVTVKDTNTNCISPALSLVVDTVKKVATPTGYVSLQPTCSNPLGTFIISSPHGNNYAYYINGSILPFVDTIYPGSSSSTYSIVAFDANTGCFSDTLNLTLNPFIPITPTNNVINLVGCNSVIYNGITYTNNSILKDTVKSFQGCDSVYNVVNININPITTATNTQTLSSCKSIVYNGNT